MKKIKKVFSLGLLGLSASPLIGNFNVSSNITPTLIVNTTNIGKKSSSKNNARDDSKLKCTNIYVGKNVSADGLAYIGRTNDCEPNLYNTKLHKFKHNELANVKIETFDGFEYVMPKETLAFISIPPSRKNVEKGTRWQDQASAINELGVGLTCTLTCFTNEETALKHDPFIKGGIGEEVLNHVIGPQATSAKHAMQLVAEIMDKKGSDDANIIMAIDQNEAWMMEMYTGHQYCAIKMSDDKVTVAGNEFILNTLDELGISEANKENCIVSPGLLSLPVEKGFAKFDDSGIKDVYHLDLFGTYADPLGKRDPSGKEIKNTDRCHMRTWRGYSLFDPAGEEAQQYIFDKKLKPFLTPKDANGNPKKVTVPEILQVYRDEFDNILGTGEERWKRFDDAYAICRLRSIADQGSRSVHIISSDPKLPKELACNEWICPTSSNYAPYILINSGIESFEGEYGYSPERWGYDDNSAATVLWKLNSIAWQDRKHYGYPLQTFWQAYEYIFGKEMQQVINDASKLSLSDAKNIITNFNKHIRDIVIQAVRDQIKCLESHIMNDEQQGVLVHKTYKPQVELSSYLTNLGWSNFKKENNSMTFKYNNILAKIDFGEGYIGEKLNIKIGDVESKIDGVLRDDKIFVDFAQLNELIKDKASVITININDYLKKFNHWVWIAPTIVVVVLAAALTTWLVIRKKKIAKQKNNS